MLSQKIKMALSAGVLGLSAWTNLQAADFRIVDDFESGAATVWEDAKLADSGVVKSITVSTDMFQGGSHALKVVMDSLDGTVSASGTYPRQTGVQTVKIPAAAVNMGSAYSIGISVYALADTTRPATGAILQARIFVKTGAAWKWSTTEQLNGNIGMTDIFPGTWIDLERPLSEFYTDTTVGITAPNDFRSMGIQFFTWGGSWSGTIYIDDAKLIDALPVALRQGHSISRMKSNIQKFSIDGRRLPLTIFTSTRSQNIHLTK